MDDPTQDAPLILGEHSLRSRLLVGTGKYASFEETARALELCETDCVTVAVRRVNLDATKGPSLLEFIDAKRYVILPNTAGCFDAESAVRTCVLARDLLGTKLVKLEVLGDKTTLLPDPVGTLEATQELVSQGFDVMVYCSDDPRMCVRLAELGVEGVLLNSAIALAKDPLRMAVAMRDAASAGRQTYLAGPIPKRLYANASSPMEGMIAGTGVHAKA